MDKLTAILLAVVVLGLAYLGYVVTQAGVTVSGGKQEIVLVPQKAPVPDWTFHITLKEGIGPNSGQKIAGTVYVYLDEITDVYDIPGTVNYIDVVDVNGSADYTLNVGAYPEKMTDSGMPVWFVGEANGYYKNVVKSVVPKEATDTQYDRGTSIAIALDKIATMTWSADDAYRGADSPVLRYKTADEIYKSIFEIKPTIDFETDKPSGIFIVDRITFDRDANTDYTNIDTIEIKVGENTYTYSPSDLPKTEKLEDRIKVTRDEVLNVEVTVTTVDGSASLTSGSTIVTITLKDPLGNTYSVPVKVA